MTEENIFEEMENSEAPVVSQKNTTQNESNSAHGEVDYEQISNTAVGENKKYIRESLNGQTVEIKSARLFNADTSSDPITALTDKNKKYYKCKFILEYNCKNKDGVYHREYISGCIQHVQTDGSLSSHSFWYEGANNQVANLWEIVAKHKNIKPEEMSPRMFLSFLNSGVKVKIQEKEIDFGGKIHKKNLPIEIVS